MDQEATHQINDVDYLWGTKGLGRGKRWISTLSVVF